MDGSSVYKQSGGVEWLTGAKFPRDGWIVYETVEGHRKCAGVELGAHVSSTITRYAYLDPAPPTEPKLKWHLWSESKPEGDEHIIDIDTSGAAEGSCYDGERRPSSVWWAYAPCSSKYGE